jgi:hypothetical protein
MMTHVCYTVRLKIRALNSLDENNKDQSFPIKHKMKSD